MTQKIPKILHFCCFNYEGGKKLPDRVQYCMRSWKQHCADWTWRQWTLDTYNVQKNNLTRAYAEQKKWNLLSDYVRFHMLYEEGGIYVDWDVELLKPLNDMLQYDAFFAIEGSKRQSIQTGFFGAVKGHPLMKESLERMQADFNKFQGMRVSQIAPDHLTDIILSYGTFPGMLEGLKNVRVFDTIHSAPISPNHMDHLMSMKRRGVSDSKYISLLRKVFPFSDNTYAVHWYMNSWVRTWTPEGERRPRRRRQILGELLMKKIILPIYNRIDRYLSY